MKEFSSLVAGIIELKGLLRNETTPNG